MSGKRLSHAEMMLQLPAVHREAFDQLRGASPEQFMEVMNQWMLLNLGEKEATLMALDGHELVVTYRDVVDRFPVLDTLRLLGRLRAIVVDVARRLDVWADDAEAFRSSPVEHAIEDGGFVWRTSWWDYPLSNNTPEVAGLRVRGVLRADRRAMRTDTVVVLASGAEHTMPSTTWTVFDDVIDDAELKRRVPFIANEIAFAVSQELNQLESVR